MPCDPPTVVALVMAAGLSRRFGNDKRLAVLADGRSLLQASLALAQTSFSATWLVLRQDDNPRELSIADTVNVIHAPADGIGLGTSLARAFQTLEQSRTEKSAPIAAAVLLGDMPWVSPATCRHLAERAHSERILRPRHAGRGGHPVVFGRAFWPRLGQLSGDHGARDILREHAGACRLIDVDDGGVLRDIDVPGDISGYPIP